MNARKRLLRWASGIMLVLGTGHLLLLTLLSWGDIAGWVDRGVWAAVPLGLTDSGADQTVASLQNGVAFWAGPGSFAVPLILLGCLTWHLAGRGVAMPAGIGWGLAAWCFVGGVLLVPSPYYAGVVSGTLEEWRRWTGLPFDCAGPVHVPGALVPVRCDVEHGHAVYVEPDVWVRHKLPLVRPHKPDATCRVTTRPALAALPGRQHTELVAIGVGHHHPTDLALADVDSSRPEGE